MRLALTCAGYTAALYIPGNFFDTFPGRPGKARERGKPAAPEGPRVLLPT